MKSQLQTQLEAQNFSKERIQTQVRFTLDSLASNGPLIVCQVYLNLRYEGTDTAYVVSMFADVYRSHRECSMMILQPAANGPFKGDFGAAFEEEYRREFGLRSRHESCVPILLCTLLTLASSGSRQADRRHPRPCSGHGG